MDLARRQVIHESMVRLADGDRSAFPILWDELWPVVLSFASRGTRNEHDAEDVAQDVFVRICSRISEFDRSRDGLSWAFGIASYQLMTYRRRQYRSREVATDLPDRDDPRPSQEEEAIRRDLVESLHFALGELSEEDRRSLGIDRPAAAATATMRKRRQRALERLRLTWRRLYARS